MSTDDPISENSPQPLRRADLPEDPIEQFRKWFDEIQQSPQDEPTAMILATASADAHPTARTVLLKNFDARGFVFFTNYGSAKARQIAENPNVALIFPWQALRRQVIITGRAEKISTAESLKYFITRPLESRLGAWASRQSSVLTTRQVLEMKFEEMKRKFADGEIPLPTFWGGYRVTPETIEYWQRQENRLHDRFLYTRQPDNTWQIERLAP